jgi:hypothetical protein
MRKNSKVEEDGQIEEDGKVREDRRLKRIRRFITNVITTNIILQTSVCNAAQTGNSLAIKEWLNVVGAKPFNRVCAHRDEPLTARGNPFTRPHRRWGYK